MMVAERNAELRRKSMELLEELTQILRRIVGSGDEQSLCMKVDANPLIDFTDLLVW